MRKKATRAKGAGRKPLDPDGSEVVLVRMPAKLLRAIDRVAKKEGLGRSGLIRAALGHFAGRHQIGRGDTERLADAIVLLVHSIEHRSGKKWFDDYTTGMALRKQVERLIFHFAKAAAKPVPPEAEVVPPELDVVGYLITAIENMVPLKGVPPARFSGADPASAILWALAKPPPWGLGSGWQRNKEVWQGKVKS